MASTTSVPPQPEPVRQSWGRPGAPGTGTMADLLKRPPPAATAPPPDGQLPPSAPDEKQVITPMMLELCSQWLNPILYCQNKHAVLEAVMRGFTHIPLSSRSLVDLHHASLEPVTTLRYLGIWTVDHTQSGLEVWQLHRARQTGVSVTE